MFKDERKPISWRPKNCAIFDFYAEDIWHGQLRVREDDWLRIINGEDVVIEDDYTCDDINYEARWEFSGGLDGSLIVRFYPEENGPISSRVAFQGTPRSALTVPFPDLTKG